MKTKISLGIGGTMILAAFAFTSVSMENGSFKELSAQATDACV